MKLEPIGCVAAFVNDKKTKYVGGFQFLFWLYMGEKTKSRNSFVHIPIGTYYNI